MTRCTAVLATALAVTAMGLAMSAPIESTVRYGETFAAYAQVDRSDGTYRRMLTTPRAIELAKAGEPLPDGTRILMETYYSPGVLSTVFHKQKVDGRWQYGSFNGQGTVDLSTRPQASCLSCHARAAETDFTFTRPALDAAKVHGLSRSFCDNAGRSPCAPSAYRIDLGQ